MADDKSKLVLEKAFQRACAEKTAIVLASTTGSNAQRMSNIIGDRKMRLIVVTHDNEQTPQRWRFSRENETQLIKRGFCILRNDPIVSPFVKKMRRVFHAIDVSTAHWQDQFLEEVLGIGGRVCFQITHLALKGCAAREGEKIVAVAGEKSGANTALLLQIKCGWPVRIKLLEIIANAETERQVL